MTFGELLTKWMKENNLTQAEVAKITGSTRAQINMYIKNTRDPHLHSFLRIIRRLQIPLKEICYLDENQKVED